MTGQAVRDDADDLAILLAAVRHGDRAAFTTIYERFARAVHGIVLARAGRDDADDLVQEVFLRVHAELPGLRDGAALPGWICTIARNLAADWARSRQRKPRPAPLPDDAGPAPAAGDHELGSRVLALVRTLPEAYRETLVLRLVEGLNGPEIAARTGLTHGSVRVNLTRGMALLRPLLAQEGWS